MLSEIKDRLMSPYRVHKAVGTRLLILVDLVDDQEHDTHQEGQSAHHQQGHLRETRRSVMLQWETLAHQHHHKNWDLSRKWLVWPSAQPASHLPGGLCNCSWCFWEVGGERKTRRLCGDGAERWGVEALCFRTVATRRLAHLRVCQRLCSDYRRAFHLPVRGAQTLSRADRRSTYSSAIMKEGQGWKEQPAAFQTHPQRRAFSDGGAHCCFPDTSEWNLWRWSRRRSHLLNTDGCSPLVKTARVNFRAWRWSPRWLVLYPFCSFLYEAHLLAMREGGGGLVEMLLFGGHHHGSSWINKHFGGGVKWITLQYCPDMEAGHTRDEDKHRQRCGDGRDGANEPIRDRQRWRSSYCSHFESLRDAFDDADGELCDLGGP